jgi:pullulanase/glycogen debranching enzyme
MVGDERRRWDAGFGRSVAVYLNGQGIPDRDARGQQVTDDSFVLCFNAHHEPIEFTLPPAELGEAWLPIINTSDIPGYAGGGESVKAESCVTVDAHALYEFCRHRARPSAVIAAVGVFIDVAMTSAKLFGAPRI